MAVEDTEQFSAWKMPFFESTVLQSVLPQNLANILITQPCFLSLPTAAVVSLGHYISVSLQLMNTCDL